MIVANPSDESKFPIQRRRESVLEREIAEQPSLPETAEQPSLFKSEAMRP
jgi:hypothetical protein